MVPNARVCLYPRTPAEVIRILGESGKRALLLAGGTTASLVRDPNITTLVDLTRMGLDTVEAGDRDWTFGCNVRLQNLATNRRLTELWCGMLADAAAAVGSRPIRNAATIGGNAVSLFRWSDPPVALLAMGAAFDLVGAEGKRTLPADEFFARHPRQQLKPTEVLTHIRIDIPQGGYGGSFLKFSRTAFDLAVVSAAVCLCIDGKVCRSARVVVGGVRTVPFRSSAAEKLLAGSRLTAEVVAQAARAARDNAPEAEDIRTSRAYRAHLVEVMVARCIQKAIQRQEVR